MTLPLLQPIKLSLRPSSTTPTTDFRRYKSCVVGSLLIVSMEHSRLRTIVCIRVRGAWRCRICETQTIFASPYQGRRHENESITHHLRLREQRTHFSESENAPQLDSPQLDCFSELPHVTHFPVPLILETLARTWILVLSMARLVLRVATTLVFVHLKAFWRRHTMIRQSDSYRRRFKLKLGWRVRQFVLNSWTCWRRWA